ncbi:putative P-loop containing nucleoside triphosphate hydrolase [Helianthus annuus]|nr:putative P-loop containing nucleoside triphosphate hydrolase [Helianthus annuus]
MEVDVFLQLKLMSEEDAWNLFLHSVGPVFNLNGIESPTNKIVAAFSGLPLAIKTLGNSLKDKRHMELWQNMYLRS